MKRAEGRKARQRRAGICHKLLAIERMVMSEPSAIEVIKAGLFISKLNPFTLSADDKIES